MIRCHIKVFGKVQGIGFRYFCQETAQNLGVSGWVRNCPDGAVELEAQASPHLLAQYKENVKNGHPWARVERMEEWPLTPAQDTKVDFEILL